MEEAKKPWTSKTLWVALIVAVAAFIPGSKEIVGEGGANVALILSTVFAVLRIVTKGKISIE